MKLQLRKFDSESDSNNDEAISEILLNHLEIISSNFSFKII